MQPPGRFIPSIAFLFLLLTGIGLGLNKTLAASTNPMADQWRAEHRFIDLHQHINYTTQHLSRAVAIMDTAGIGIAVNLSGGTVTRTTNGGPSAFERNKKLADSLFPGRFLHYQNLDYKGWD